MLFTFEFDCPEFSGFTKRAADQPSRFELEPTNPNDQWFMAGHNRQSTNSDLIGDQRPAEQGPVIRKSFISNRNNQEPLQFKDKDHNTLDQAPRAQNLPPNNKLFKKKDPTHPQNYRPNILAKTSQNQHKKKLSKTHRPKMESKKRKDTSLDIITRSKSGLESKFKSTDRWPCPFSTKLQRQWQNKYGAKWYDLSPKSKDQAARTMKQIEQQQKGQDWGQAGRNNSKQK